MKIGIIHEQVLGGSAVELTGTLVDEPCHPDKKLFEQLVKKHHRQAYNIAYRMAGNHADAEDLTQEAFIRAFRFFGQYQRDLPFESWLYKIISNVFVDKLRKKPKVCVKSLDQPINTDNGDTYLDVADRSPGPEDTLMSGNMEEVLQKALESIPPVFRLAVIYVDIDGLSYEEVAEATNTNVGTVRSRLHRGRKMLREALDKSGRSF